MRISNVGLFVKDLEGARKFFEDFFGAQVHATYEEDDGYKSYIMSLHSCFALYIFQAARLWATSLEKNIISCQRS